MKINGITDVFFDLDHTLWDFDKNSAFTFDEIFKLNNLDIDTAEFLEYYVPINLKYWRLYREDKIDKESLRFVRLNEAFLAVGMEVEKPLINKLSEDYITNLSTFNHLFENTFEILDYLCSKYNLHIITNGFDEVQHKKLTNSGISKYFKTVTNSEMVGVKKPNPRIFHYAIDKANAVIEQSIMIGDSYEADIIGAQNVGMDTVFFDVNDKKVDNNLRSVNNLIQLKKYL